MADERELFKGTAQYYAKYRRGYPPEFFEHLRKEFQLDGTGRLLDLGCGTGQITVPFSRDFKVGIGVDLDQDMLTEAGKYAEKAGVINIQWVLGKAEETIAGLGMFRLTTIGAAFHWMDRENVLQQVYDHTDPHGGLALVYDEAYAIGWDDEKAPAWKHVQRDTIRKYLGERRRAGNTFYTKPQKSFETYLIESPFGAYETWEHDYTRTWTVDQIIGFLHSTSFAAPRLFGERLNEFDAELRSELLKLNPDGTFSETSTVEALIARK